MFTLPQFSLKKAGPAVKRDRLNSFLTWVSLKGHCLEYSPLKYLPVLSFVPLDTITAPGSPLLKEEGFPYILHLTFDTEHPFFFHRSSHAATLSSNNNPIYPFQIQFTEILQKRFTGKKTDWNIFDSSKIIDSLLRCFYIYRHSQPCIGRDGPRRKILCHPVGSLCQQLIPVARSLPDGLHDSVYKFKGNIFVK